MDAGGSGNPLYENDRQLKVWGNVTGPAGCLFDNLAKYGWHVEYRGWPRANDDKLAESGCANLVALDNDPASQLTRLEPLLARGHAELVFVCPPQALENEEVRAALAEEAYAYHCLPGDVEELDALLRHARAMSALRVPATPATAPGSLAGDGAEYEMVGTSPAMRRLFSEIRKVASVDAPILIRGESGSGKELAAESIHERSARAEGPFIAINCAALPAELVQSELFGHEKGAFTGASQQRVGNIEAASGGTLLLDEIGDLPLSLQVHLLRFLETGKIQRIGSNRAIPVDVRVLAATHVALEQAVHDGEFREDLYHRLNVVTLRIPPLRERPEDIEVLARFFFQRFAAERPLRMRGIREEALQSMCRHDWPGNVRELINRMRRAMVMGEGRLIKSADLDLDDGASAHQCLTLDQARARAESKHIRAALSRNRHSIAPTARELGISRVTLYRLIEKHQLDSVS
jgi:DNA-binding NtrC family response regulator